MKAKLYRLTVYSAAHFCVDFCCALLISRAVASAPLAALIYLVYNYCAFALQMPIGLLADRLNRNAWMAAIGCGLTGLACAMTGVPLAAAIVAGLGNALFHVGGGVDVLNDTGKKAAALGVYVSPGAAGLFVGNLLGKQNTTPYWGAATMALCIAGILLMAHHTKVLKRSRNARFSLKGILQMDVSLPALCLFLVVILRSFAGMTMAFGWKSVAPWGVASMLCVVFGKALGGFVMDKLGARLSSIASLAAAAVLFLFADQPWAGCAAILLFNMTMPVTLSMLARAMPGCKGFSFGLLTFALFLGFVPVCLGMASASANWLLSALCVLSALLMLAGAAHKEG